MADFNQAFEYMMDFEDHSRTGIVTRDEGGVTKYGISFNFLKNLGLEADFNHDGKLTEEDVVDMTYDEMAGLYREHFWKGAVIFSQRVANKFFDMYVNMGGDEAVRLLQRSLRDLGNAIVEDGKFGPKTLAATNDTDVESLLKHLRAWSLWYYNKVSANRGYPHTPGGWLARGEALGVRATATKAS